MKWLYILIALWGMWYVGQYIETYEHPESIHIIRGGAQP